MRRAIVAVGVVCVALVCSCGGAAAPPVVTEGAGLQEPRAFSQSCALRVPDDVAEHASAPGVPRPVFERALAPVLLAVCACVHPGDEVSLVARMLPNEGEVRAAAPDDARVDACLRSRLDPGRFAPIEFEETASCASCDAATSRVASPAAVHAPPRDVVRPGRPHVAITVPLVLVRP